MSVEHLGDVQFELQARGHRIICDQPEELGGHNEGMTPPEFLLASLGSCAGYYAAEYLRTHNLAPSGTRVRVTADKVTGPARLDNFRIEVDVPASLKEGDYAGIERAVRRCLIHNTLLQPPSITLAVQGGEAVARGLKSVPDTA
jgi:uncharacterized OsmC-like protein